MAFVPKDVAIKMNMLLWYFLIENTFRIIVKIVSIKQV